ncbi:hypothetical protein MCEMRE212_00041 [Candidatus Nanopelagicaceae bacterium]
MTQKPRIIVVGLVRNCATTFEEEFSRLVSACSSLKVIDYFFVESDSLDNSLELLNAISLQNSVFHFKSLGHLETTIPNRIERIRFCRNEYVKYIRTLYDEKSFDFVLVADMDGINSSLSKGSINSCFKENNWDALFSNQLFGISDLLALRANDWLEEDYLVELERSRVQLRNTPESSNFFKKLLQYFRYDKTRRNVIYSRMRCLGIGKQFIPVNSAFGGIAFYRSWCFFRADYLNGAIGHECEHVSFHRNLSTEGARMYINPRFINSIINTYNVNKIFLIRNLRIWRWNRQKTRS